MAYDEKELNDNFTCSGIRFDPYDDQPMDYRSEEENEFLKTNNLNILHLKSSHGLTEKFRSDLREQDNLAAQDPYILILNKQLSFRNPNHPSVGYIESERMGHDDFYFDE